MIYNHLVVCSVRTASRMLPSRDALSDHDLDRIFRALSDATRRDIIARLLSDEPSSVSALASRYDMSFAAVQKHVAVLERARLVTKERRGREQIVRGDVDTVRVDGGRPVRPNDVDLRWVGALLHRNGVIEESGLAAAVLNHPANGVAWLANKLAPWGESLQAGQVVLAGSFTRPVNGARGDTFHVDYGPLGSIGFRFA